jgi:hypothetical protein
MNDQNSMIQPNLSEETNAQSSQVEPVAPNESAPVTADEKLESPVEFDSVPEQTLDENSVNNVTPAIPETPEQPVEPVEVGPEPSLATPESAIQGTEIAPSMPVQPPIVDDQIVADPQISVVQPTVDDNTTPSDIGSDATVNPVGQVVDDTAGFPGDNVYVREVNKVISEDKDKPYQEEEDSEEIGKDYLAKRFGVDADMDKEQ